MRLIALIFVAFALVLDQAGAQSRIDQLSAGSALSGTETFPMCQGCNASTSAVTTTANAIKTFVNGAGTGVSSIAGASGAFNLGGGLQFQNNGGNNFLNQVTGSPNVLRNASMVDWRHQTYLWGGWTSGCCVISINSGTATISNGSGGAGTQLNITSPTTGSLVNLNTLVGGSGYTGTGTYTNVPLTGGSGSGAHATVVVAGGAVTTVTVTNHGTGYVAGDTLSASNTNLGGAGSGFSIKAQTVTAIQLWQRVTDAVNFTTNGVTNALGGITALGTVVHGSGYTNGTYTNVPLIDNTTASAVGALATIVVSGNVVSTVTITNGGGANYVAADVLTAAAANIGGTGSGFTVPVSTVASSSGTVLHFASTTGISSGMWAYDVTNPTAILGGITVASTTGTTVTMNTLSLGLGATAVQNPGVASGDVIAFSFVQQGTQIIGDANSGNCSFCTGAGGAGKYLVNVSQNVASETMQTAGGWGADGVYVIPIGPAGDSVSCSAVFGVPGGFTPVNLTCSGDPGAVLTDLVFRFPMDNADTARLTCPLYAPGTGSGQNQACVSGGPTIAQDQVPVTFHASLVYDQGNSMQPAIDTKYSCPPAYGSRSCIDNWQYATTDLAKTNLNTCTVFNRDGCEQAFTWYPSGGYNMEVNYHVGALPAAGQINLVGFDLKQTPGATCNGTALTSAPYNAPPPTGCIQNNPAPLEIPNIVYDQNWNKRFTQAWGAGNITGWNAGNKGPIETAAGYAGSTTSVIFTFPLPVQPMCNTWIGLTGGLGAPSCPVPNAVFSWGKSGSAADLTFTTSASSFSASAIAVNNYGLNGIQFIGTFTGLTGGAPGDIEFNTSHGGTWLIDSSEIGD